uniref:Uncharacterized protein n=1 Tax=Cannabis sativa TaxID=3483 RepID=A0A803PYP7_CANSA
MSGKERLREDVGYVRLGCNVIHFDGAIIDLFLDENKVDGSLFCSIGVDTGLTPRQPFSCKSCRVNGLCVIEMPLLHRAISRSRKKCRLPKDLE